MAEQYWTSTGLRYAILYPPQIYGPDQFTQAIMPKLMQKMLFNQGNLLKLAGGVNPIHVNNMISVMYSLCQQRIVGAFCVAGDGQSISMEDIARALQQAATTFLAQYEMTPYRAYVVEGKAPPPLPPIQETHLLRFFPAPHSHFDFTEQAQHMVSAMWRHKRALVTAYAALHYPRMVLTEDMHRQLYWLYNNSVNTSQSHPQVQHVSSELNQEIKRVLVRLNGLHLLESGTDLAYQEFTVAQPLDDRLSRTDFQYWAEWMQTIVVSPAARQCLVASCFITKSDAAVLAAQKLPGPVSGDSERFITDVVCQSPTLFPMSKYFASDAQELLPFVFLQNSHGRHMLDGEGNRLLYAYLRTQIKQGRITRDQYELWFARWVLNIAGLKGHVDPRGAYYLTQGLATSLRALKHALDTLWDNPDYDVYLAYLTFKQQQLGVSHLYLASLGALLRKHTAAAGADIQAWFGNLPQATQLQYTQAYERCLESLVTAPTYQPVVADNLLGLGCSIAKTLTLFTQIDAKAMVLYEQAIQDHSIGEDVPLCYREFAYTESLEHLVAYYDAHGEIPDFSLDLSNNMAMLAKVSACEARLQDLPKL